MKDKSTSHKSNRQYYWELFVNRLLLPLIWTLIPLAVFALVILILSISTP